ncbi:hypothetical protein [Sandaracinus amylolyticus]|uniref:monooxygenase n=1 Tax=Sandaracinus amylolyticus TaxID=927083 RepID=UPI001F435DC8|nr:hypothetical protein [Sandaracinus amylolyticus]UJR82928.1 Hypothetical protein I5071_49930 [Sandaracinus amylolyticus]
MGRVTRVAVGTFVVLGACDGATESDRVEPTFYGEIAPLLAEHCQTCHQPGGIGPFPLITYEEVSARGPLIAASVASRSMPPFLPDNSGDCATYHDAMWLEDAEIELFQRWVDAGHPMGDASRGLPEIAPPPALEGVTHEARMPEAYAPASELLDDYRCVLFDDDVEGDAPRYVTDYEVVPGEPRVVHHVVVFQPQNEEAVTAARALDDAAEGLGYPCLGGPGEGVRASMLMNWAPGTGPVHHPEGTGVAVDPARPLLVQIHYHYANGALPDRTAIRMRTATEVEHPMRPWFFTDGQLNLPPRQQEIEKSVRMRASTYSTIFSSLAGTRPIFESGRPLRIMGVRAHMHGLGRRMHIERSGSAGTACLVDISNYRFGWQRSYFLETPVTLSPEDELHVTCTYSTMERDEATTWGEGTLDEMCLATFYTIEE